MVYAINSFVRIINIHGWLEQEMGKRREILEKKISEVQEAVNTFIAMYLSDVKDWVTYLQANPPKDIPWRRITITGPDIGGIHLMQSCVGHIVQVIDNPRSLKGEHQQMLFSPLYINTMCLYSNLMVLETPSPVEVADYTPFHGAQNQRVKLTGWEGIKYLIRRPQVEQHRVYPSQPDVNENQKKRLYEIYKGRDLVVWIVEPSQGRVGVSLQYDKDPVYVDPNYLEVVSN